MIRCGRTMVATHTRTIQNGKTTTVARFHHSTPWEGVEYSDAPRHRSGRPTPSCCGSTAGQWTLPDDEYLATRIHAHDGFAVEDGWIHLPNGSILATLRQTRLAG